MKNLKCKTFLQSKIGNEMKNILFNKIYINLQQFQATPENKTQGNS